MTKRFSSAIHKLGINPCVDVPTTVVNGLLRSAARKSGPVPVRGRVNKTPIVATVVKYKGAWRLYLNTEMRKNAGVDVGDVVRVFIEFDPAPRILAIPQALRSALRANQRAKATWEELAPSHRREYLLYLNSLKTQESLERSARKVIRSLMDN